MDNTNNLSMNEGMFSAIDQIRQDSKNVRDFVKNVFSDREFKKMSNDKDFIKYLKSIYEGTMIDEEHVKFSNRTQNGTITTGSVQTTNESSMKLTDILSENKYSIIDPKGNVAGTGTKDQTNRKAKTLGGSKKGYFVVPVHRAKEARRAMERFKFNFKNAKLKDKMSGLYFDDEMFGESTDGVPQGYNPMVEDKNQIKDLVKKVKHEKLFYDVLVTMEKKYGKNKYRIWLEKSLKDFGVNPKHYDYRTNGAAEEKLFQLGRK